MAMAYVLAFSMLSHITHFCSDITQFRNETAHHKEPSCLPPFLDKNLQLHEISHKWQNGCDVSISSSRRHGISNASESTVGENCMLSWIAGLGETTTEQSLEEILSKSKAIRNVCGNWMPQKDHNKLGYSYRGSFQGSAHDKGVNASESRYPRFDLVFDPGYKEGTTMRIVLMYMKSYGPDWNGSTVRMSGFQEGVDLDGTLHKLFEENLRGYFSENEPQISVSLTSRFSRVSPTNGITRIRFELISGHQFKFTGMVIC